MEMERGRSAGERWRVREAEAAGKEKHVFLNNPTNRKKVSKKYKNGPRVINRSHAYRPLAVSIPEICAGNRVPIDK